MAGGKLSPRQRMINLMYLVFIAMLALNMSKEVLSAFGLLNEKISDANVATTQRNQAFMEGLAVKAADEPGQYAAVEAKAREISQISDELDTYLASLKTASMEKVEDPTDYEVMDKADFFNNLFFRGDKYKEGGQEFIDKMDAYRTEMIAILSDPALANVAGIEEIKKSIETNFSTEEETNRNGKKVKWLNYNYEGFPLVASLTKLTQIQADVKSTKSEVLQRMLAGQQAAALSFSNYSTLLETSKSAYYAGENFDGSIVLGRTDESTKPKRAELTLDGRKLVEGTDYTFEGGKVKLNVSAGSPGDHKIEGFLYYGEGGEETEVAVDRSFATISMPNSAVIAADKMNVVYRGVDNPMTVSIPGIPDNKVNASAPGLSRVSGSKYVMRPGSGRTVTISANGTLPDGKPVGSKSEFRIKDIPPPVGAIRGETGIVRMERGGLEISSVSAVLPDFDFDVNLNVTGFSFKVSGQPTVRVNGTKLDAAAKGALRRAGRGETVQIFDINAKVSGSSVVLKKTSPVIIELTN
ncbi:gliding motility protein GldM [Aequorivita sp. F47161]|uniref:Gliding motility protein GldM n=1 Tax=Aequorivita vitellina TaxID=2874475 RepID=A0A9X1QVI5_9FLAO|nr:gliding motility protein GldM [Aequorivita vitellina]MCG2418569.1 gliding motility protein GldM [Aequorivita vitellina]MCZ4319287.1 gliding motility protein GldM [Aequorivita viscosa]